MKKKHDAGERESRNSGLPVEERVRAAGDDNKETSGNKTRKKKSLSGRILRLVFLWIPLCIAGLIAIVFIAADLYLTPSRVEKLAVENFNSASNGTLSLNVRTFSLYRDIVIENIVIKNPEEFGGSDFFTMKKFVLKYGFFSMLFGQVHFDEIGLYKPRVYLIQKKGVWNFEKLMKPGAPKEPEVEEPEEPSKPRSEINLPWSMKFLFNFILDDLYCSVRGDDFRAEIDGVTLKVKIDVPPFKTVPLSPRAVTLLKDMEISLNPDGMMNVNFYSPDASVEPPLILSWKLLFNKQGQDGRTSFSSAFRFGTYKTPVRFKQSHLAPLDFLVSYDLYYDPINDFLKLNDLGIRFRNSRWISLGGTVSEVTKNPRMDIRMNKSEISLAELYPYYRAVTGDESMRFAGKLSLFPLTVKGTPDAIAVKGALDLSSLQLRMPDLDLNVPSLRLNYALDKNGSHGKIGVNLAVDRFTYNMNRSLSGVSTLLLDADINSRNDFGAFDLNRVDIRFFDPRAKEKALELGIRGEVNVAPSVSGNVKIGGLVFRKNALVAMLPPSIGEGLAGLPFEKPVNAEIGARFSLGDITHANVSIGLKVPDFDVNDLAVTCDVTQNAPRARIDLSELTLKSRSRGLSLKAGGFVETRKSPLSDSDLKLKLTLDYPKKTKVYGPWVIAGSAGIDASMKGDLAKGKVKGSVKIKGLSVENAESMLDVKDANLDFPFDYDFGYRPSGKTRLAVGKESFFDSGLFRDRENLTIGSIASKHPARDMSFVYLKDLRGTLFFRDNSLEIQELRASILDGTLYGKDIFFYLSDLNVRNMEYRIALDLTNLDVGLIDNPDQKKKSHDAELSLNVNLSGKSLDFAGGMNVNGSVNIYKIGDRFANKLMKGLSQEKGKSKLGIAQPIVDNLEIPRAFYYYIDNGVMYADVSFKSKAIGYIIGIKDDRVKFDRIPIQEYLRKVQE